METSSVTPERNEPVPLRTCIHRNGPHHVVCGVTEAWCQCPYTIALGDLEIVCKCCGIIMPLETYEPYIHWLETHDV